MESMENFRLHGLVVAEPDAALVTEHALDKECRVDGRQAQARAGTIRPLSQDRSHSQQPHRKSQSCCTTETTMSTSGWPWRESASAAPFYEPLW
jgi:hypothetical protein